MKPHSLSALFGELPLPVVVCRDEADLPVEYLNVRAQSLFAPSSTVENLSGTGVQTGLDDLVHFEAPEAAATVARTLRASGRLDRFHTDLHTFDCQPFAAYVYASRVRHEGADYFVLFLVTPEGEEASIDIHLTEIMSATFSEDNVDDSINTVLALSGRQMDVSRTYIFEEMSPVTTRNTYEWCAPGIQPAIQDLQDLRKEDYPYDAIVESGIYVANDLSLLDAGSREILESQGIKAVCIIPIYDNDKALGYVGYDDVEKTRQWSHEEILFLKGISYILASLMKRRDSERSLRHSMDVLQIVTDNSQDIIYANRLDDYTLLFVSKTLADALGTTKEELLGKPCYEVFGFGDGEPCSFCPIPKIKMDPGADRSEVYQWEHRNAFMNKTYLAKDSLVRWVDGSLVHMEVAVDISQRIAYEESLRRYASTDAMTGIYNREWGTQELDYKINVEARPGSLCFIDLDGLKKTNDTYGHAAGDEMITETVRLLGKQLGKGDFLCRWGGDEFLVWVAGDEATAQRAMAESTRAAERYNAENDKVFTLSFSYGVVPFAPGKGITLDGLVTEADSRMYKNKMAKRGVPMNRRRDD